jgi:hypothetical protein
MNRCWYGLMAACSGLAVLTIGAVSAPQPAQAQFGPGNIPGIIGGILGGGRYYGPGPGYYRGGGGGGGCRRNCGNRNGGDDDSSSDTSSRSDNSNRPDVLTPPSSKVENNLLHVVARLNVDTLGGTLTDSGTNKAVSPLGKAIIKDSERDWTEAVQKIIKKVTDNQDKRVTTPGDVTEHAIEQSLDRAIKDAKLDTFASFLGENWTPERLRSMVLDLVSTDVESLFKGNSRGYAQMQEVNDLIVHAAQATYRRIFELSELMAANRSAALFVQRLYQSQGDRVNDDLRAHTSDMLARAANAVVGKFEAGLRQNENGYALRYRGERIVFDCLSEYVDKISSSETGIAERDEIAHRIDKISHDQCAAWLDNQFGTDAQALKPQKPMPLRAVWTAIGPRDDSSMYGQATNEMR